MIPVCQKTFTMVLCISKDRIKGVMRRFYEKEMAKERRGGDRKSQKFEEKRQAIQAFILYSNLKQMTVTTAGQKYKKSVLVS